MVLSQSDNANCEASGYGITLANLKSGDSLSYPLALLKGSISFRYQPNASRWPEAKLQMRQYSSQDKKPLVSNWPVVGSEFKCLAFLSTGNNHIILEYCGSTTELVLTFHPRKTKYHVIPVYIICKNHDGQFQAPASEDNTVQSACKRIALGARLIQCLMAEKLMEAGFERKSFQLEQDINPSSPDCVVFESQLEIEKARKMKPEELWEHFGRELMMSPLGGEDRKFLAFLSCTRYQPKVFEKTPTHDEMVSCTEAYVALGGGGLALFGTACLHTWASRVEDVIPRFLNTNKVNIQHFMDDSCYRGTYGGCYATTLGSVCHELGHTFDLGHSSEGIMARGFDNLDLVFALPLQNNNYFQGRTRNVISPVCKELPQHSRVSLSKVLNVSYSAASPMKCISNGSSSTSSLQKSNKTSGSSNSLTSEVLEIDSESCQTSTQPPCFESTDDNPVINAGRHLPRSGGDSTYWTRSCAFLLNYHRWFNSEQIPASNLDDVLFYDADKNAILSSCGVCVAEVRDNSGLILYSVEFLNGANLVPLTEELKPEGSYVLVVEDTKGNLLKHSLI